MDQEITHTANRLAAAFLVDGTHLGPEYYNLLPNWMELVEQRSKHDSAARLLAWIYALALASEPYEPITQIDLVRWVARFYRAFRNEDDGISVDWLDAGEAELIELGHIRSRHGSVELTWPASHQLYVLEPKGTA